MRLRRDISLGLLLAVAAALPAGLASAAPSRPLTPTGTIAFERAAASGPRIWVATADGRDQREVPTSGEAFDPTWSPRGRLAFVSTRQEKFTLFEVAASGANLKAITAGAAPKARPTYSPDGRTIAFESGKTGQANILLRPPTIAASAKARTIVPADDSSPTWSPDSSSLAFSSDRSGHYRLYVFGPRDRAPRLLTRGPGEDLEPRWSPDGRQIAFTREDPDGNYDVWTIDLRTRRERRLTDDPAQDFQPTWSPDSRFIAFASSRSATSGDENYDIFVMTANGEDEQDVSRNPAPEIAPAWAPPSVKVPSGRRSGAAATLTCNSGTPGDDTLNGTNSAELICGRAGADRIHGGGGNDEIYGNDGPDRIFGDGGDDQIYGGDGNDRILGNGGADELWSRDSKKDVVAGGPGSSSDVLDRSVLHDPVDKLSQIP